MSKNFRNITVIFLLFAGCAGPKVLPAPEAPSPDYEPVPVSDTYVPAGTGIERRPLFVIERSLNRNVVHYDAQVGPDGKLDPKQPVVAYWLLLAEGGGTAELNLIESFRAYGFVIEKNPSGNTYKMTLSAAPRRPFLLKSEGADTHVEGLLHGRPAIIDRIFVSLSKGVLGPRVETIELFGRNLLTGKSTSELIMPR